MQDASQYLAGCARFSPHIEGPLSILPPNCASRRSLGDGLIDDGLAGDADVMAFAVAGDLVGHGPDDGLPRWDAHQPGQQSAPHGSDALCTAWSSMRFLLSVYNHMIVYHVEVSGLMFRTGMMRTLDRIAGVLGNTATP